MTPDTQRMPRMTIRMHKYMLGETSAIRGDSNAFKHMRKVPETTIKMQKDRSYVRSAIKDDMRICYIMSSD
jgi:hypothetical protein